MPSGVPRSLLGSLAITVQFGKDGALLIRSSNRFVQGLSFINIIFLIRVLVTGFEECTLKGGAEQMSGPGKGTGQWK